MADLIVAGLVLVFVGFAVVAMSMFKGYGRGEGKVKGGGVVMIGPIPIIFGSDAKWASVAIGLAIALVLLTLLLGLV
jgi:uncharacterized protein (TIGR00304 family)